MSVWVCTPSARPVEHVREWAKPLRERGYKIALWRDSMDLPYGIVDYIKAGEYPGFACATNELIADVSSVRSCDWFVVLTDDTQPDLNHTADEIAAQCTEHFKGTFGVMQPTGDRWCDTPNHPDPAMRTARIERIAGSPWLGLEWCLRSNQGRGALYPEFKHMFVDEALWNVARKCGVYWQRQDLIHLHQHALRPTAAKPFPTSADVPDFARKWYTAEHWQEAEALFKRLRDEDWAPCMPLEAK